MRLRSLFIVSILACLPFSIGKAQEPDRLNDQLVQRFNQVITQNATSIIAGLLQRLATTVGITHQFIHQRGTLFAYNVYKGEKNYRGMQKLLSVYDKNVRECNRLIQQTVDTLFEEVVNRAGETYFFQARQVPVTRDRDLESILRSQLTALPHELFFKSIVGKSKADFSKATLMVKNKIIPFCQKHYLVFDDLSNRLFVFDQLQAGSEQRDISLLPFQFVGQASATVAPVTFPVNALLYHQRIENRMTDQAHTFSRDIDELVARYGRNYMYWSIFTHREGKERVTILSPVFSIITPVVRVYDLNKPFDAKGRPQFQTGATFEYAFNSQSLCFHRMLRPYNKSRRYMPVKEAFVPYVRGDGIFDIGVNRQHFTAQRNRIVRTPEIHKALQLATSKPKLFFPYLPGFKNYISKFYKGAMKTWSLKKHGLSLRGIFLPKKEQVIYLQV